MGGQGRAGMTAVFEGVRTMPTVAGGTPGAGRGGRAGRAGMTAVVEGVNGVGQ